MKFGQEAPDGADGRSFALELRDVDGGVQVALMALTVVERGRGGEVEVWSTCLPTLDAARSLRRSMLRVVHRWPVWAMLSPMIGGELLGELILQDVDRGDHVDQGDDAEQISISSPSGTSAASAGKAVHMVRLDLVSNGSTFSDSRVPRCRRIPGHDVLAIHRGTSRLGLGAAAAARVRVMARLVRAGRTSGSR